jgi:hypothetical protein
MHVLAMVVAIRFAPWSWRSIDFPSASIARLRRCVGVQGVIGWWRGLVAKSVVVLVDFSVQELQ